MKKTPCLVLGLLLITTVALSACVESNSGQTQPATTPTTAITSPTSVLTPPPAPGSNGDQYSLEQAMSDNAQLSTIAFSGLAFITGSAGADTFFPPGKVADFFGFQYMRDVDTAGYGHNTTFLTRVANDVLYILNDEQKSYLGKMEFDNYLSWPDIAENETLKQGMTNNEYICVMTYASELFSWYKGGIDADVYFCPERHGTYFGGFYMKDYAAMNNPDYFISTSLTGDSGQGFLDVLNADQRALITGIIDEQRAALAEIAQIRTTVSTELRRAITGGSGRQRKSVYSH